MTDELKNYKKTMGKKVCCFIVCFKPASKSKKHQKNEKWGIRDAEHIEPFLKSVDVVSELVPASQDGKLSELEKEGKKDANSEADHSIDHDVVVDPSSIASKAVEVDQSSVLVDPAVPEVDQSSVLVHPEVFEVDQSSVLVHPEVPEVDQSSVPVDPEVPEIVRLSAVVASEVPEVDEPSADDASDHPTVAISQEAHEVVHLTAEMQKQPMEEVAEIKIQNAFLEHVVQPKNVKSKEEVSANKIQTAFRGYLARRGFRALRGLVRLKTLVNGGSVQHQTATTLRSMQTLARVQSQVHARRIRLSEDNDSLQRLLEQKKEKELEKLKMGNEWDDSPLFKEQIEAKLLHKYEATLRREKALAYAYNVQQTWRHAKSPHPTYMDPNNPHWGWSWLERWMASRPWERRYAIEKDNDHSSVKSACCSVGGEITKGHALRELNGEKPPPTGKKPRRPAHFRSPSTPPSKFSSVTSATENIKSANLHRGFCTHDDDTRSIHSVQSERPRVRSIAASSVRDDMSETSSPGLPGYMVSTKSAAAKSRMQSPLALDQNETTERGPVCSARKRLSFSGSPAGRQRRHSVPPKLDPIKDIEAYIEQAVNSEHLDQ